MSYPLSTLEDRGVSPHSPEPLCTPFPHSPNNMATVIVMNQQQKMKDWEVGCLVRAAAPGVGIFSTCLPNPTPLPTLYKHTLNTPRTVWLLQWWPCDVPLVSIASLSFLFLFFFLRDVDLRVGGPQHTRHISKESSEMLHTYLRWHASRT